MWNSSSTLEVIPLAHSSVNMSQQLPAELSPQHPTDISEIEHHGGEEAQNCQHDPIAPFIGCSILTSNWITFRVREEIQRTSTSSDGICKVLMNQPRASDLNRWSSMAAKEDEFDRHLKNKLINAVAVGETLSESMFCLWQISTHSSDVTQATATIQDFFVNVQK